MTCARSDTEDEGRLIVWIWVLPLPLHPGHSPSFADTMLTLSLDILKNLKLLPTRSDKASSGSWRSASTFLRSIGTFLSPSTFVPGHVDTILVELHQSEFSKIGMLGRLWPILLTVLSGTSRVYVHSIVLAKFGTARCLGTVLREV